ncbi:hypothetical protein CRM22_006979 [Opisthorchis felineus]|uniref:Elongator complex protein 6 n=1 Tax=Opisthorchis felineus TaxID=147828 RepID=A0A4S2LII1_OPIFE|nr:hypothetical protein CRM22_006979 [Opisthorchis felineus]
MDFSTVVEDLQNSSLSCPGELDLWLILSHNTASHEPLLSELIRRSLNPVRRPLLGPAGDPGAPANTSPMHKCILFCTHKSPRFYQQLLSSAILGRDQYCSLSTVDVGDVVRQSLTEDCKEVPGFMSQEFSSNLWRYISDKSNEFAETVKQSPTCVATLIVDNLTCLFDLGLNARQIDRLLVQWSRSQLRLLIGCHVGQDFQDESLPEHDHTLVHCLETWKNRAPVVLEVRPLETGYTTSLDGEIEALNYVLVTGGQC